MINQKFDHGVVILRVMVMSGINRNVRSRVCLRLPVAAFETTGAVQDAICATRAEP